MHPADSLDDASSTMSRVPRSINCTVNTMNFLPKKGRLKNVGALPLMAAHRLLGKDERSRAWYEARGRKEAHGIEGKSLRASTEKRNAGKPRPYPSREIKQ
jgi:hypothetical protein